LHDGSRGLRPRQAGDLLLPTETPLYDIYLSSSINFLAHDVEELVTEVARIVSQPPGAFGIRRRCATDSPMPSAHHGACPPS
jgi:hypothetical protein